MLRLSKRSRTPFVLAAVFGLSAPARADLWQGAPSLPFNRMSLGAFGQLYFGGTSTEFQGFAQFVYGFGRRFQGEVRMGMGSLPFIAAVYGKYQFLDTKIVDMALWTGLRVQNDGFWDLAVPISHAFKGWELYVAPLVVVGFDPNTIPLGVAVIPGLAFVPAADVKVYVEATVNGTRLYNAFSAGARLFLD